MAIDGEKDETKVRVATRFEPQATRVEDRDWLLKNFMTELFIVFMY
jgi:hypothetical protein